MIESFDTNDGSIKSNYSNDLPKRFICIKCHYILSIPVQLECGCRICFYCFKSITQSGMKNCPSNDEECSKFIIMPDVVLMRDKSCERDMKYSKIKCPNEKCMEIVSIYNLNGHLHECRFSIVNDDKYTIQYAIELEDNVLKTKKKFDDFKVQLKELSDQLSNIKGNQNFNETIEDIRISVKKLKEVISKTVRMKRVLNKPIFIWPIKNFKEIYKDKSNITLMSPSYYISEYGYKMAMKLYPHGDGLGKNTHISIYFMILRGKFDPLLDWPFQDKVTIEILGNRTSKIYSQTFKSSLDSVSVQKPKNKINPAAGDPQFILKEKIIDNKDYLINETLYIKMKVHI